LTLSKVRILLGPMSKPLAVGANSVVNEAHGFQVDGRLVVVVEVGEVVGVFCGWM